MAVDMMQTMFDSARATYGQALSPLMQAIIGLSAIFWAARAAFRLIGINLANPVSLEAQNGEWNKSTRTYADDGDKPVRLKACVACGDMVPRRRRLKDPNGETELVCPDCYGEIMSDRR